MTSFYAQFSVVLEKVDEKYWETKRPNLKK